MPLKKDKNETSVRSFFNGMTDASPKDTTKSFGALSVRFWLSKNERITPQTKN